MAATNDLEAITLADLTSILTDIGVDVTLNRATKVVGAISGSEDLTFGGNVTITVVFQQNDDRFLSDKEGLLEMGDAIAFALPSDSVDINDKITYNSIVYKVKHIIERYNVDKIVLYRFDNV